MLQNRVDPQGNIIRTSARGAWMGNRGLLHNDQQEIRRTFKLKAWLICQLQFKDRHRPVMAPRQYTELFFMDEATAFAAGHRPCFECRRADYEKFKACWLKGNPQYGFDNKVSIQKIDEIIHNERINPDGNKTTFDAELKELPDGTFVFLNHVPHLLAGDKLHPWTAFGYRQAIDLPKGLVPVLTPLSVVNTFSAGYVPQYALSGNSVSAN